MCSSGPRSTASSAWQLCAAAARRDLLAHALEFPGLGLRLGLRAVPGRLRGRPAAAPELPGARIREDGDAAALDRPGRGRRARLGVAVPAELRGHQRPALPARLAPGAGGVALRPRPGPAGGDRPPRLAGRALLRDHAAGWLAGHPRRTV